MSDTSTGPEGPVTATPTTLPVPTPTPAAQPTSAPKAAAPTDTVTVQLVAPFGSSFASGVEGVEDITPAGTSVPGTAVDAVIDAAARSDVLVRVVTTNP